MNYGDDPLLEKLEVLQTSFQPFTLCVIYNPQGRYARLWVISYMVIKNKGKHYQFSIKKKKREKRRGKKQRGKTMLLYPCQPVYHVICGHIVLQPEWANYTAGSTAQSVLRERVGWQSWVLTKAIPRILKRKEKIMID